MTVARERERIIKMLRERRDVIDAEHESTLGVSRPIKIALDSGRPFALSEAEARRVVDALEQHEVDSAPYVCPGCYAVGERCYPGCDEDAFLARLNGDDDDNDLHNICGTCGGDEYDRCICPDDYDGMPEHVG